MGFDNIALKIEDRVATISVDRPRRLNALNSETMRELAEAIAQVADDAACRVLLLTGAGDRSFIAGADVTEMAKKNYVGALRFAEQGQRLCEALEKMDKPAIAAINGYALGGGCELAIACDFAYASENARIGQPEVTLGIIPGFGGTQRLLRRVTPGVAREMVLSGRALDAEEALRVGLVNGVYPQAELMPKVRQIAARIVENGPLAVGVAKRLLVSGHDSPLSVASELERQAFAGLFATEDKKEGMEAFLSKRSPNFRGE